MKMASEVISFLYENNLTVVEDNVLQLSEAKTVQRDLERYQSEDLGNKKIVSVFQKKKGKPTKKATAFAIVEDGHVTLFEYAVLTTDVDFREIVRSIKSA